MYGYNRNGRSDEAFGLLEEMLDSKTDAVPWPNMTTFARIVAGFSEARVRCCRSSGSSSSFNRALMPVSRPPSVLTLSEMRGL